MAMLLYTGLILLYVLYLLLPLLIYWRCGRILRRLEAIERWLGDT